MGKKKVVLLILCVLVLLAAAVTVLLLIGQDKDTARNETPAGETVQQVLSAEGSAVRSLCLQDGWVALGDEEGLGLGKKWYEKFPEYGDPITLPGMARDVTKDTVVWYANTFTPQLDLAEGERVFLRLSGITYFCDVWLNGQSLCETHEGGNEVFYPEATGILKNGEENTLVLRVYAPLDTAYGQVNTGKPRIQQPVYVFAARSVILSDVYAEPDCESGKITVHCSVDNPTDKPVSLPLTASVCEDGKNMVIQSAGLTVRAEPGESVQTLELAVEDFKYWSPEHPTLYELTVNLNGEERHITTGFKTLCVDEDGYFRLNGERYYIKCAHTVAQYPGSYDTSREIGQIYQELVYLKSCGFNAVRFLMNGALEQQIALCDRIGLIVYEESPAAWKVTDSDVTEEQFHNLVSSVLKRDRNHVSLGMFGMLNETKNEGDTTRSFASAVAELPSARELAPKLLFMLSSARWDGERSLASASNPGETEWSAYMGQEGTSGVSPVNDYGYTAGMGDLHFYPLMPYGDTVRQWYDGMGKNGNAVFLSEAGAGSQANVIGEYLNLQEKDVSKYSFEYKMLQPQVELINEIFEQYGCDKVFSSAENMLTASQSLQASQRALLFNYIRSNPDINGYSLTMTTDTGFTGEGVMTMYGEYKPDMTETLQAGWADLRWCIFTDEPVYDVGEPMTLVVKLSDISGILKPEKDYTAVIRVTGDSGTVWKKEVTFRPAASFVTDILSEAIPMNVAEGEYRISVSMTEGAHPLADEHIVNVLDPAAGKLSGKVSCVNVSEEMKKILGESGASVSDGMDGAVILVGQGELSEEQLRTLYAKAAGGAQVVFLDASALKKNSEGKLRTPFDNSGRVEYVRDWLYHKEQIVFDTAYTDGMEEKCLMDPYYYEDLYSLDYISGMAVPDELSVMVFSAGLTTWEADGVISGFQLGSFDFFDGRITLNTLKLCENCAKPTGERLLVNIVAEALASAKTVGAASPEALAVINEKIS